MSSYTKEDVIRLVEEEDVEFIRLQFTDMFGNLKNVAVTASQLERAMDNKYVFDGSSLYGDLRRGEDIYLFPDRDTFAILPWRPQQGKVARMLCDVCDAKGNPLLLFVHEWAVQSVLDKNIGLKLSEFGRS